MSSTQKPARGLAVGDVFSLHIYVEVLAVAPVTASNCVKVKIAVEDQGHRSFRASGFAEGPSTLEFLNEHHVLEFLYRSNRKFHTYDDWDGDWGNDDVDVPTPPTPVMAE
jgi:hypothetical protein